MSNLLIRRRQRRRLQIKRRLLFFVIMPLVFLFASYFIFPRYFVINITDSMPIGLYKKVDINNLENGDIVSVCLDNNKARLAIQNSIIVANEQCNNGSQMLIKEIIATPNDQIEITETDMDVTLGDTVYRYPAPRYSFSPRTKEPVLTLISTGTYRSTGYWLYGSYDYEKSWDSRYFGEVAKENIINKLEPIFVRGK
jgi:conjugative transfer signal peptidase TraF